MFVIHRQRHLHFLCWELSFFFFKSPWKQHHKQPYTRWSHQENVTQEITGLFQVSQRCIVCCWICVSPSLHTSELLPPSVNQPDDLYDNHLLDLRGSEREMGKGGRGGRTGCRHVSVLGWECRWSRGIRRLPSLAFTECALNELINIHWPALACVPSDGQNKVAEVTHFTRRERERGGELEGENEWCWESEHGW